MKIIKNIITVICLMSLCSNVSFASLNYQLQAVGDCSLIEEGSYGVHLYVKATGEETAFSAGNQNYRFHYNHKVLKNPNIVEEGKMSGFAASASGYAFFAPHTLTGSAKGSVSYNIHMEGGNGYFINESEWTHIGTIHFEIVSVKKPINFSWADGMPLNTRVIDNEGTLVDEGETMGEICEPNGNRIATQLDIILNANPAQERTALQFEATEEAKATINVYNMLGQQMYLETITTVVGINELEIELAHWQSGIYFIRIAYQNKEQTIRLLKQ